MDLIKQIDETISFNENNIRVIGTYGEPWFVAKDICNILELPNVTNALKILPEKWRGLKLLSTFGGEQNMNIVNEAGLYKLIMRSNKPVAQKFQEVVCEEILPSLRKKGEYKIQSIIDEKNRLEEEKNILEEDKNRLEKGKLNLEIDQNISQNLIKELNKKLERKQRAKYDLTNCVYVISNNLFKGYFKIGKSSSFNNRLNSYTAGAPIEYNVDYICKVRNKSEETAIENLILQILGKYRVKNHMDQDREWLNGIDLDTIKKEINNCVKFINKRREKYESLLDKKEENNTEKEEDDNIEELKYEEDNTEESKESEDDNIKESDDDNIKESEDDNIKESEDDNIKESEDEELKYEDNIEKEEEHKQEYDNIKESNINNGNKNKKINTKYVLSDTEIQLKNNPTDFIKFIKECCEIGDNEFYVVQADLKLAFRLWCRTPLDMIDTHFTKYIKENYKDTRIFIDNQRRHVFKGLKLKPLTYSKSNYNFDFEEFIEKKCKVDYLHKISYIDFIHFFTEWKKQSEPSFTLNKYDQINIKEVLESFFCRGRVLSSVQSKTKNLVGVLGLGIKENNYGLVEKKRQNKVVKEYDIDTNKLMKEYESIVFCAKELNIPFSTFSNHIRNQTVINGKYYKI